MAVDNIAPKMVGKTGYLNTTQVIVLNYSFIICLKYIFNIIIIIFFLGINKMYRQYFIRTKFFINFNFYIFFYFLIGEFI